MKALPKIMFLAVLGALLYFGISHAVPVYRILYRLEGSDPIRLAIAILRPEQGMKLIVSLAGVGSAIYVILARRYGPMDKYWAYSTMGLVLGYWVRA